MQRHLTPSYGLTTAQLAQIRQLENECNRFEGLKMRLNWLSLETRPVDQINDFLMVEGDRLVGYLALYAFNQKEVEVSAMTHPRRRRQGIFRQLLAAAKQELTTRHIPDFLFMCERASQTGAVCLQASGAHYDFSEYKMSLNGVVPAVEFPTALSLRPATVEDIAPLGQMDELCFGVPAEVAQSWLAQDLGRAMVAFWLRGVTLVLIGLLTLTTRRRAMSQLIGFVMMDNGIATVALLTAGGVPLVVELGVSLDVLLVVLILLVLTSRMQAAFGGTDLDELKELHD